MADLESDIRLAIRQVRFGQNESAIRILERILNPGDEDIVPSEYPKWIRHPEDKREALTKDREHEAQILKSWGLELDAEESENAKEDPKRKEDGSSRRGSEVKERVPA